MPRAPRNNSTTTALRVVAGDFKGRKLTSPHTALTHPMGTREKNALFNMIDVRDRRVLDAYAGSGALGIEALSRGAREVVFVENDRRAISTIRQNLTGLGLSDLATKTDVLALKVADFVKKHAKCTNFDQSTGKNCNQFETFDVIIADPPYDKIDVAEVAELSSLLATDGTFALSSPARQPAPAIPQLMAMSSHTYAEARITIYYKGKE